MIIYKITNKLNGKVYIGQTIQLMCQRWASHNAAARRGSKFPIHAAIRKYGSENFEIQILKECDSKEQMDLYERTYIERFGTRTKTLGYNITGGGEGTPGRILSEETKHKISLALQGNRNSTGRKLTLKHKIALSQAHRQRLQRV